MEMNRLKKIVLVLGLLIPTLASAQVPNHTYPRIAIWQWAGADPSWYARFDMAMTRIYDKSFVATARSINPEIIWIPTQDFNTSYDFIPDFPDAWYLRDSRGNKVGIHYGPDSYYADLSDLCARVNNQRLIDYYPEFLASIANSINAAGIASDGLYYKGHLQWNMWSDVDLDRNGVNDLQEHGKDWVIEHWAAGVDFLLNKLRDLLGDKLIMINSGSSDTPGEFLVNGYVHEYGGAVGDWSWERSYWLGKAKNVQQPPIFLQQSNPDQRDPTTADPSKNSLAFMRFSLVKSMLLGRYYTFEHVDGKSPDHFWNNYYDEFDVDVGHPASGMQKVKAEVWARFFDGGVAIANFSGSDQTISEQDLSGLVGYSGPYYRILGGQDVALNGPAAINNGQKFTTIILKGYSYSGYNDVKYTAGDGIILLKKAQAIVSDIIIDNVESGTSPVSNPAVLTGSFAQAECGDGRNYYKLRCDNYIPGSGSFAIAHGTSGEAVFTPTIGVPGDYDVYEWHPSVSGAASSVSYTISHANGQTQQKINQSSNSGKWNYLGRFQFNRGTSGNVKISASGANGAVVADAIMLVHASDKEAPSSADIWPPAAPRNTDARVIDNQ